MLSQSPCVGVLLKSEAEAGECCFLAKLELYCKTVSRGKKRGEKDRLRERGEVENKLAVRFL